MTMLLQRQTPNSSEPWDERRVAAEPEHVANNINNDDDNDSSSNNNSNSHSNDGDDFDSEEGMMRYSRRNNNDNRHHQTTIQDDELDDGDLPPLSLGKKSLLNQQQSLSQPQNSHPRMGGRIVGGQRTTTRPLRPPSQAGLTDPPLHQHLNGKQQEFWTQLDATNTDEERFQDDDYGPDDEMEARRETRRRELSDLPQQDDEAIESNTKGNDSSVIDIDSNLCAYTLTAMGNICGGATTSSPERPVPQLSQRKGSVDEDDDDGDGVDDVDIDDDDDDDDDESADDSVGDFSDVGNIERNLTNDDKHDSPHRRYRSPYGVEEHTAIEVEYVEPDDDEDGEEKKGDDTLTTNIKAPDGFTPARKSAYLAAMAKKAKEEFEKKTSKRNKKSKNKSKVEVQTKELPAAEETTPDGVYSTFNAAEKRKFLKLINSGLTPTASCNQVIKERQQAEKVETKQSSSKGPRLSFWGKKKNKDITELPEPESPVKANEAIPANQAKASPPTLSSSSSSPPVATKEEAKTSILGLRQERWLGGSSSNSPPKQSAPNDGPTLPHYGRSVRKDKKSLDNNKPSPPRRQQQQQEQQKQQQQQQKQQQQQQVSKAATPASVLKITTPSPMNSSMDSPRQQQQQQQPRESVVTNTIIASPSKGSATKSSDRDAPNEKDAQFAASGINYYDAVRKERFESDDEDDGADARRRSGKKNKGSLLPTIKSPKFLGFSPLSEKAPKDVGTLLPDDDDIDDIDIKKSSDKTRDNITKHTPPAQTQKSAPVVVVPPPVQASKPAPAPAPAPASVVDQTPPTVIMPIATVRTPAPITTPAPKPAIVSPPPDVDEEPSMIIKPVPSKKAINGQNNNNDTSPSKVTTSNSSPKLELGRRPRGVDFMQIEYKSELDRKVVTRNDVGSFESIMDSPSGHHDGGAGRHHDQKERRQQHVEQPHPETRDVQTPSPPISEGRTADSPALDDYYEEEVATERAFIPIKQETTNNNRSNPVTPERQQNDSFHGNYSTPDSSSSRERQYNKDSAMSNALQINQDESVVDSTMDDVPQTASDEYFAKIERELLRKPQAEVSQQFQGVTISAPPKDTKKTRQPSPTVGSLLSKRGGGGGGVAIDGRGLSLDMDMYMSSTELYSGHGSGVANNDNVTVVSAKSTRTTGTTYTSGASVYTSGMSVYTQGTAHTTSSRKRRPGAARARLAKAKESDTKKNIGWEESMKLAAESNNRSWDPKKGWVDFEDPSIEVVAASEPHTGDKIHVSVDRLRMARAEKAKKAVQDDEMSHATVPLPFPQEWERERMSMIRKGENDKRRAAQQQAQKSAPAQEHQQQGQQQGQQQSRSIVQNLSIDHTADIDPADVPFPTYSKSTAASRESGAKTPERRSKMNKARLQAAGRSPAKSPSRPTGWVETMRAATAGINVKQEGPSWDPNSGWNGVEALHDDTSLMTETSPTATEAETAHPPTASPHDNNEVDRNIISQVFEDDTQDFGVDAAPDPQQVSMIYGSDHLDADTERISIGYISATYSEETESVTRSLLDPSPSSSLQKQNNVRAASSDFATAVGVGVEDVHSHPHPNSLPQRLVPPPRLAPPPTLPPRIAPLPPATATTATTATTTKVGAERRTLSTPTSNPSPRRRGASHDQQSQDSMSQDTYSNETYSQDTYSQDTYSNDTYSRDTQSLDARQIEKLQAQRIAEEKKLQAQRLEAQRLHTERLEAERLHAERLQAENARAERLLAERMEAEKKHAERLKTERIEAERLQAERLQLERREAERIQTERLQAERMEAERLQAERMQTERIQAERMQAERMEAERIQAEKMQAERMQAERTQADKSAAERKQLEQLQQAERYLTKSQPAGTQESASHIATTTSSQGENNSLDALFRKVESLQEKSGRLIVTDQTEFSIESQDTYGRSVDGNQRYMQIGDTGSVRSFYQHGTGQANRKKNNNHSNEVFGKLDEESRQRTNQQGKGRGPGKSLPSLLVDVVKEKVDEEDASLFFEAATEDKDEKEHVPDTSFFDGVNAGSFDATEDSWDHDSFLLGKVSSSLLKDETSPKGKAVQPTAAPATAAAVGKSTAEPEGRPPVREGASSVMMEPRHSVPSFHSTQTDDSLSNRGQQTKNNQQQKQQPLLPPPPPPLPPPPPAKSEVSAQSRKSGVSTNSKASSAHSSQKFDMRGRSGRSFDSASTSSKPIPKLIMNKRDTSPIRRERHNTKDSDTLFSDEESKPIRQPSPTEGVTNEAMTNDDDGRTLHTASTGGSSVKQIAQQWESRAKASPDKLIEPLRSEDAVGSAEWKTFLVKKVRAESAGGSRPVESQGPRLDRQHLESLGNRAPMFAPADGRGVSLQVQQPSQKQPTPRGATGRSAKEEDRDSIFDFPDSEGAYPQSNGNGTMHQAQKQFRQTRNLKSMREHTLEDLSDLSPIRNNEESDSELPPSEASSDQQQHGFFKRLAACAGPIMPRQAVSGGANCDSMPLAHLAFLRTNPNVSTPPDKRSAARFAPPALCGRPDIIVEEDEDDEDDIGDDIPREVEQHRPRSNPRSSSPRKSMTDVSSVISDEFGAKTAYLEAIAMKTAVSGSKKNRRRSAASSSDVSTNSKHSEKWQNFLDRKKGGSSLTGSKNGSRDVSEAAEKYASEKVEEMMQMMASRSRSAPRSRRREDEIGAFPRTRPMTPQPPKTDNMYEIKQSKSDGDGLIHRPRTASKKSESARAAEDLAAARVEAMMQSLSNSNLDEGEI